MNQSLKEFINSIKKSTTDANLDITNLEEDDSPVMYNSSAYHSKQDGSNQSIQRLLSKNDTGSANSNQNEDDDVEEDTEEKTLNSNSTTAEFKKYLEDLKKNYLEKLTFSCPSKVSLGVLIKTNLAFYLRFMSKFNFLSSLIPPRPITTQAILAMQTTKIAIIHLTLS